MSSKKTYVISLGGSLIVPNEEINWQFLKKFRRLILDQLKKSPSTGLRQEGFSTSSKKGKKFFLVAGGGTTARKYSQAADKVVKIAPDDLDWLGIHSSRLNAHLLRTIFREQAHPEIIKNPTIHIKTDKNVMVGGGWKPGWSTDYVATMIAQEYEITQVVNLTNIDYVYTKDPGKHQDAEKIKEIDWADFRKLVGDKWTPGLNTPFDPIATQKAQKLGLEVTIMNGSNLSNLKKFLNGEKFKGTVIKN
jgi:uridylate kinase